MNKKFSAFFTGNYGMEVTKNLAYGRIKDYEVNASLNSLDNVSPLKMHVSFYATDEQKRGIEAAIRNLALKYFKMMFTPYGLALGFNDITLGRLLKRLPEVLDKIFTVLSEGGALTGEYCPVCGKSLQETEFKKCNIDGFTVTIDNDCVGVINDVITQENQDFNTAPTNYLKGFLGAVIGGLAGAAVSIGLSFAGFVSSLSAVISIMLGTFLYQKFHGKPDKMMIVIVSLTTLVMLAATIPVIYIFVAYFAAIDAGVSMSAIDAFKICMDDPEFSRLFYCDLALILLFSAIGTGFEIFALNKKIKRRDII